MSITMTKRLLSPDSLEFTPILWDGVNRSGWQPLDDKVLVLMEEHVSKTAGGVIIPDKAAERQSLAALTGVIVAIGPAAFRWSDDQVREWTGRKPAPGDRVQIDRYSGQLINGRDGFQYRLMSQACVGAVELLPEPTVVPLKKPRGKRAA